MALPLSDHYPSIYIYAWTDRKIADIGQFMAIFFANRLPGETRKVDGITVCPGAFCWAPAGGGAENKWGRRDYKMNNRSTFIPSVPIFARTASGHLPDLSEKRVELRGFHSAKGSGAKGLAPTLFAAGENDGLVMK